MWCLLDDLTLAFCYNNFDTGNRWTRTRIDYHLCIKSEPTNQIEEILISDKHNENKLTMKRVRVRMTAIHSKSRRIIGCVLAAINVRNTFFSYSWTKLYCTFSIFPLPVLHILAFVVCLIHILRTENRTYLWSSK